MSSLSSSTLTSLPHLLTTIHFGGINSTHHPDPSDPNAWVPFRYTPTVAGAIVFIILFLLSTTLHIYQAFRFRAWFFIPFIIGGLMETIGYIGRALCAKDIWNLNYFIIQSILLLIAPAFFAATVYMCLRRVVVLIYGEAYCVLPSRWISRIFVTGDCFAFLLQASGGGMQAASKPSLGQTLIMAGLGVQVAFFAFFMVTAVIFQVRARRAVSDVVAGTNINWVRLVYVLYGASILILVRSIFRLIEYGGGNDGTLLRHEFWLYIFDALLMFLVMVVTNIGHPGVIKAQLMKSAVDVEARETSKGGTELSNRMVPSRLS